MNMVYVINVKMDSIYLMVKHVVRKVNMQELHLNVLILIY